MLPAEEIHPHRPKVTVLCGFLGAGKTTLLAHLLRQKGDERWAAIVNDVASVQIDGPVLKRDVGDLPVVELENGCVCCSSADDLGEAVARLATHERLDHIWIETTGVALPQGVITLFTRKNPFGRSLGDFAELANVVTVVDGAQLLSEWTNYQGTPVDRQVKPSTQRPVLELLIEQIEGADVVVVNKSDLVDAASMDRVCEIIRGLKAEVEVMPAERGQLPMELFVGRARFNAITTPRSARWVRLLNEAAQISSPLRRHAAPIVHRDQFGIETTTFMARQPFRRAALEDWLRHGAKNLLRAKGFCWITEQPDEMIYLSLAASGVQLEPVAYWWASRVESGRASAADVPPAVRDLWVEPQGDRRQELVFIGVGLDAAALHKELIACFA